MIRFLPFYIIVFLYSMNAFTQKHYLSGYVVLHSGDTIHGIVKDRTPEPFGDLFERIHFKSKQTGKKRYGAKDIKSYKVGNNVFESHRIALKSFNRGNFLFRTLNRNGGERAFLKVIKKGKLNYYNREFRDPDSGYYDYHSYYRKEGEYKFFILLSSIFGFNHKETAEYLKDCPLVSKKVLNKELKNFITIQELYEKKCNSK